MASHEFLTHEVGRLAEVGGQSEFTAARFDDEAYGIGGIVTDAKGIDGEFADLHGVAVVEMHDGIDAAEFGTQRVEGHGGDVDGDAAFSTQHANAVDVIAVFMGDEYRAQIVEVFPDFCDAQLEFFEAESVVDQDLVVPGFDKNGVPGAATTE